MASEQPSSEKEKSVEIPGVVKKKPSPYDLNSNDNPGSIITQVQLRGENYEEWAKAVRTSLCARRKWGFVDGTVKQPNEDSPEIEDWWTVQSMVVSWILNTIETSLRSTISYMENAKELWDDIKERFSVVKGPRIQQLKSELAECKEKGMTMVNYYGKLKKLWDKLGNYQQIPTCTYDVLYGTVRSNLLATDPLPSLNRVYSTFIQEERVKDIVRTKEERIEIVSLAVQTGEGQQQGRGANSGRDRGVRANAAQVVVGRAPEPATEVDKGGLMGLSTEQWQTLLEILNNQKGIANERMTGCPVGLPDGQKVFATKEGTTTLEGGLKINNVLYVPKLNCSLDRTSRTLIGLGERIDGLYYFRGIRHEKAFKVDGVMSLDLWHRRMGHPSLKITECSNEPITDMQNGEAGFDTESADNEQLATTELAGGETHVDIRGVPALRMHNML
ncbi:Retrotransposon gag domain [Sesbania bispinosa]|nr:Retrotransposon gag domain [Sesbania bispinosa]